MCSAGDVGILVDDPDDAHEALDFSPEASRKRREERRRQQAADKQQMARAAQQKMAHAPMGAWSMGASTDDQAVADAFRASPMVPMMSASGKQSRKAGGAPQQLERQQLREQRRKMNILKSDIRSLEEWIVFFDDQAAGGGSHASELKSIRAQLKARTGDLQKLERQTATHEAPDLDLTVELALMIPPPIERDSSRFRDELIEEFCAKLVRSRCHFYQVVPLLPSIGAAGR